MRVINYDTSRVTALFPLEEVLPLSGINDRELIEAVTNRYRFLRSPDLAKDDITKDGYKFASGQFSFQSSIFRINEFSIFRDGLVILAATTDGSEAFIDDLIDFVRRVFSFREFETKPRRFFQSQIVAEFDRSPEKLLKSLSEIVAAISEPLSEIYGTEIPMEFARFDFAFDKSRVPNPALSAVHGFIMERRVGVPFNKQRFFCAAPMRTKNHIEVLEKIERLIR
jgi:hypothetical protein